MKRTRTKAKPEHYVRNKDLLPEMIKYREEYMVWVENDKPDGEKPKLSDAAAEMIYKICLRTSFNHKFINYPFREEFVSDSLESCILYAHNFNPEKSENPFAYFTQYCHNANIRRIKTEKHQRMLKAKFVQNVPMDDELYEKLNPSDLHSSDSLSTDGDNDGYMSFIQDYYDEDLVAYELAVKKSNSPNRELRVKKVKTKSVIGKGLFSTNEKDDEIGDEL